MRNIFKMLQSGKMIEIRIVKNQVDYRFDILFTENKNILCIKQFFKKRCGFI